MADMFTGVVFTLFEVVMNGSLNSFSLFPFSFAYPPISESGLDGLASVRPASSIAVPGHNEVWSQGTAAVVDVVRVGHWQV